MYTYMYTYINTYMYTYIEPKKKRKVAPLLLVAKPTEVGGRLISDQRSTIKRTTTQNVYVYSIRNRVWVR